MLWLRRPISLKGDGNVFLCYQFCPQRSPNIKEISGLSSLIDGYHFRCNNLLSDSF